MIFAHASGQKALWILDGQHRISGLSQSSQRDNPVPVVLLLDGGAGTYTSPLLASLFAQVTTSATKLDDLHNEWLTFALSLDGYSPTKPKAVSVTKKSFEAVAALCRTPSFQGQGNPFLNQVQFNEHLAVTPTHGGFVYKCTALKDLLDRYYFNQPAAANAFVRRSSQSSLPVPTAPCTRSWEASRQCVLRRPSEATQHHAGPRSGSASVRDFYSMEPLPTGRPY